MVKITLKDGSVREYEKVTALDVAMEISEGLARQCVAAKVNDKVISLTEEIKEDSTLELLKFDDEGGASTYRHTTSHILAHAVKRLYGDVALAIGPSIDNGFYYDFDLDGVFSEEDFEKIEAEMKKIIEADYVLEKFVLPRDEAIKYMNDLNESYKVELINDLPEDEEISFYKHGDFVDLCAGPHLQSTGKVKTFKLLSVAGAYWRGDSNKKMLQRIYGTSFFDKKQLKKYLFMLEEAKKRDHRKLGRELELFEILEEGPGFPFFLPKGMIIRNILEDYWRVEHVKRGYQEIKTPMILSRKLWEQSGHWENYKDSMYTVEIDENDFAIKPMNCPGSMLVYKQKLHSYKEFPLRVGELGLVHRHELSGTLHGLMRVRCFTQDDAHIFMTEEQIENEVINVIDLIDEFYRVFGFKYKVELSTRPEKSIGTEELWEKSTTALRNALDIRGINYKVNEGDGAFYGPKIDFHLEDSIGRTWQCGTIQLDMNLPEKFDLSYIGSDGEKHRPVVIHRVVFGSIERFIAILIEHYAGAMPLWLAPVQVKVLTIANVHDEYANKVKDELLENGIRVEVDSRNEKIGYKIREARNERIPYILTVGDKEIEANSVSARNRRVGDLGSMSVKDVLNKIIKENQERII
ncbi:MAG: threonine--tRNA ligase [Clostridiales bacterium]|nr:threonine--tRNA ligase [Clostridiales bacterium]